MSEFIKSKKFTGVSHKLLKNKDKSYYISYKMNGKFKRTHIEKKSEGITEAYCHQKRNDAINKLKFGDTDSIIKTKIHVDTFDIITLFEMILVGSFCAFFILVFEFKRY